MRFVSELRAHTFCYVTCCFATELCLSVVLNQTKIDSGQLSNWLKSIPVQYFTRHPVKLTTSYLDVVYIIVLINGIFLKHLIFLLQKNHLSGMKCPQLDMPQPDLADWKLYRMICVTFMSDPTDTWLLCLGISILLWNSTKFLLKSWLFKYQRVREEQCSYHTKLGRLKILFFKSEVSKGRYALLNISNRKLKHKQNEIFYLWLHSLIVIRKLFQCNEIATFNFRVTGKVFELKIPHMIDQKIADFKLKVTKLFYHWLPLSQCKCHFTIICAWISFNLI